MSSAMLVSGGLFLAVAATLGRPGVAVPLYAIDAKCLDDRFPLLAGAWAIGCGTSGRLDRAVHIPDGREVTLSPPMDPRATAASQGTDPSHAVLVEVTDQTRIVDIRVHGAVDRPEPTRLPASPVAPPAADATHFAAVLSERVEALAWNERVRPSYAATPVGWYPPALAWPHVAWVERGPHGDEDIFTVQVAPSQEPHALADGPGFQRHVVSDGERFVWVDDGNLVVWDPFTQTQTPISAQTGFHAPPTMSNGVVCWEQRRPVSDEADHRHIDVVCSDGLSADGPGNQLSPSRSGPWLLYRDGAHVWLRTAP